nr:phospholipase A1-IIdelta-like [Tanacetum cinerariifolium]
MATSADQMEGEEDEYIMLDLDGVCPSQVHIPPNASYVLTGLDTLNPILIIDDKIKLIGEYEETIGTCIVLSETAEPLLRAKALSLTSTGTGNGTIPPLTDSSSDEDDSIPFIDSLAVRIDSIRWLPFDLAENGITVPISAFVFGSPQVGNKAFNDRLSEFTNVKVLHIKNKIDLIPLYPSGLLGYMNTGVDFLIDTRKSPSLKDSNNTGDWHNLQGMLHVVAGWNGEDGEFELQVKRSLTLVNKSSEFLKDEYLIPGSWWIEKNKGVILDANGEWVLEPPDEEDIPVPESIE